MSNLEVVKALLVPVFLLILTLGIGAREKGILIITDEIAIEYSIAGSVLFANSPAYDALAQPGVTASFALALGGDWGLKAGSTGFYIFPGQYSQYGYRYRGYYGGLLELGPFVRIDDFRLSLLFGGALARYELAWDYFFFPGVTLDFQWIFHSDPDGSTASLLVENPYWFRRDAFSWGLGIGIRYRQALPKGGRR